MELGYINGDICNRYGCLGIIQEVDDENSCSCHINPPCSHCVNREQYCPSCNWNNLEDERIYKEENKEILDSLRTKLSIERNENEKRQIEHINKINDAYNGKIKLDKIDWYIMESWKSGYKAKGFAPNKMTYTEILKYMELDRYNLPRIELNKFGGFIVSAFTD